MKYKFILFIGSIIIFLSAIGITMQNMPAKVWSTYEFFTGNIVRANNPSVNQPVFFQAGDGTPTQAYYLPLINVAPGLTTPTPTSTQVLTWYGEGVYDDFFPGIDYLGSWHTFEGDSRFQGTLHYSTDLADVAMFHFIGRQVSVFYSKDPTRGDMEVWIDGVLVDTIEQYANDLELQMQWNSSQLSNGNHTLVLKHVSGSSVDLDALVISDYAYPPGNGVPPLFSTSFYMDTIDSQTLYDLGCELGTRDYDTPGWQDSLVVLDFGMPREWNGNFGASLFGLGPVTTSELREAVKWFGVGYFVCSFDEINSHLRIGVGTSNYHVGQVTYDHGRQWAFMVNEINDFFIDQGLFYRVDAVGANDMELGWNTPEITRAWVDGYDSANAYSLLNFGDAAGCPTYVYTWWTCSGVGDWSKEDVWYISYGAPPSYPLPLIYADSGVNAEQWHLLSIYAYQNHGMAMEFQGEMTQYQACLQLGGCDPLDNTPGEGWTYLWTYLNSDSRTAQDLRYSTDILYFWLLQ